MNYSDIDYRKVYNKWISKHQRKMYKKMQKMNKHRKTIWDRVREWFKWI